MPMSKLTLTAPREVIKLAEEQAKRENTSISAMFASYVLAKSRLQSREQKPSKIGSLTQSLSGLVTLPDDFDEKEFMSDVMSAKHSAKS